MVISIQPGKHELCNFLETFPHPGRSEREGSQGISASHPGPQNQLVQTNRRSEPVTRAAIPTSGIRRRDISTPAGLADCAPACFEKKWLKQDHRTRVTSGGF